jgi:heptosyltransferase-1/heptosyltransferase-2
LNILVVKLSSLGDIVLAMPSLRALRAHWPEAHISVAVNRAFAPLLSADPAVDHLVIRAPTPKIRRLTTLRQALGFRLGRRGQPFDLAIDLQGNAHSAIWTYSSGARRMVGFGDRRPGWQFNVPLRKDRHAVDENAGIVERLGVAVADRRPVIRTAPADQQRVGEWLSRHHLPERDFVILHPFAAWRSKEWPVKHYAAVARHLAARAPDLSVLVTGAGGEAERARHLVSLAGSRNILSAAGEFPLGESLSLWSRARLCIAGDTGALHASAALGVPVLALFGPTLPEVSGPIGAEHLVVQASRPADQDAYRRAGAERHMHAITEAAVVEAVERMLARPAAVPPSGREPPSRAPP